MSRGRSYTRQTEALFYRAVRPFVCPSVRSFARLLPDLSTRYFEKEWIDFDVNWPKWSKGQGHETVNFGSQQKFRSRSYEVEDKFGGLSQPRMYHSRPFWSNSYYGASFLSDDIVPLTASAPTSKSVTLGKIPKMHVCAKEIINYKNGVRR